MATIVATPALNGDPVPRLIRRDPDYELQYAGMAWKFDRRQFGPKASVKWLDKQERPQLKISNVQMGGEIISTISIVFDPRGDLINLSVPGVGIFRQRIRFGKFLIDGALASGQAASYAAARMTRRFGWNTFGARQVTLRADGAWRIEASGGFGRDVFTASSALLLNLPPEEVPYVDWLATPPKNWLSLLKVEHGLCQTDRFVRSGRAKRLSLDASRLDEAFSIRLNNGRNCHIVTGDWRVRLQKQSRRWRDLRTENGMLLETPQFGGSIFRAHLPLAPGTHVVTMPMGSAALAGADKTHAVIASFGSAEEECEFKGQLVSIPIDIKGADFSQIEFDEQEYCSAYSDNSRPPDSLYTYILSTGLWGHWWIPMTKARLRVARTRDHLSLYFRFRDVAFVRRSSGWRMEPLDRNDPRDAAMAVDFPPQHVLEQAFLYQAEQISPAGLRGLTQTCAAFFSGARPATAAGSQIPPVVPLDEDRVAPDHIECEKASRDVDYEVQPGTPPCPDHQANSVPADVFEAPPLFPSLAEARLSQGSWLAFEGIAAKGGRWKYFDIPLTLDGLTDWARLKLAVADPARTALDASGKPFADPYAIAQFHISNPLKSLNGRLGQVVDQAITSRDGHEFKTMIEMPARLWLSPDQDAIFDTQEDNLRYQHPSWGGKARPLWNARLRIHQRPELGEARPRAQAEVRAIGSPDFDREYFLSKAPYEQDHSTPWKKETRFALSKRDRHELVSLSALHGLPVLPRLTNEERIKDYLDDNTNKKPDTSDQLPGAGVTSSYPALREAWKLDGHDDSTPKAGVYVAPGMPVRDLRLTALGGFLDISAKFEPPAAPYESDAFDALTIESWNQSTSLSRDRFAEVVYKGFLFPLGHRAALVKRTERRFFPACPPRGDVAYLVQRYFIRIQQPTKDFVGPLNMPHEGIELPADALTFAITQTPDLRDPTARPQGQANNPFKTFPGGAIDLDNRRGMVFWPRVSDGKGGEVQFEVQIAHQSGSMTLPLMFLDNTAAHDVPTVKAAVEYYRRLMPEDGLNVSSHMGAARRYAASSNPREATFPTDLWVMDVEGRGDVEGDERYAMNPAMEGKDQPPFYPRMHVAHIDITNVQRFTGHTDRRSVVSFDPLYVQHGFRDANPSQLFLAVHGLLPRDKAQRFTDQALEPVRLALTATGDRGGGVAHPNATLVNLSRITGPVGGQKPPPVASRIRPARQPAALALNARRSPTPPNSAGGARNGVFSGADFFPEDATLLGILPLRDVVAAAGIDVAPKLEEAVDIAAEELNDQLTTLLRMVGDGLVRIDNVASNLDELLVVETPLGPVSKLYPELTGARKGLATAKDRLLSLQNASPNDTLTGRVIQTFNGLKSYNEALQNLVDELLRTGKDPVPTELTELFNDVQSGVDNLLEGANGLKQRIYEDITAELKQAARKLIKDGKEDLKIWVANVLGPDAYRELEAFADTIDEAASFSQMLERIASSASDALLYETVGRPILEAAGQADQLLKAAKNEARLDLRRVSQDLAKVADATLRAAIATMETQVQDFVCTAQQPGATCPVLPDEVVTFTETLKFLFGQKQKLDGNGQPIAAKSLLLEIATEAGQAQTAIDEVMVEIEARIVALADIEARLEAAIRKARRAARQNGRTLGSNSELTKALATVRRLRTDTGSAFERLRTYISAIQEEQTALTKRIARLDLTCCDAGELARTLGSLSRWVSQRAAVAAAAMNLFRGLSSAVSLHTEPPIGATNPNLVGDDEAAIARLTRSELQEVARAVAAIAEQVVTLSRDVSSLDAGIANTIELAKADIEGLVAPTVKKRLDAFTGVRAQMVGAVDDAITAFGAIAGNTNATIETLRQAIEDRVALVDSLQDYLRSREREILAAFTGPFAAASKTAQDALTVFLRGVARQMYELLKLATDNTKTAIDPFAKVPDHYAAALKLILTEEAQQLLLPNMPNSVHSLLDAEAQALQDLLADVGDAQLPALRTGLTEWYEKLEIMAANPSSGPAFARAISAVAGLVDALIKGQLDRLVDVDGIRREIENQFLDIALPNITLSYTFGTKLEDYAGIFSMLEEEDTEGGWFNRPADSKDLSLTFSSSFNVGNPDKSSMSARGVLQPFQIDLFQVISLKFNAITFNAGSGQSTDLDVKVEEVELGAAVEFIEQLQQLLGFGDSGLYIEPHFSPPSIEIGYMLDLGTITFGGITFINIAFGAGVVLPFDNQPAKFKFNLGRRNSPILISVAPCFGGGMFLSLGATATQLTSVEASFEYGAVIGFQFGVLKGQGRVTTGIYISRNLTGTRVSGFFVASGSARIACFGINTCLLVSIRQESGNMKGKATFTYGFSIGFKEWEWDVPVDHLIKKWSGKSQLALRDASPLPALFAASTQAELDAIKSGRNIQSQQAAAIEPFSATQVSRAVAMNADWNQYQRYFEDDL